MASRTAALPPTTRKTVPLLGIFSLLLPRKPCDEATLSVNRCHEVGPAPGCRGSVTLRVGVPDYLREARRARREDSALANDLVLDRQLHELRHAHGS